MNFGEKLLYERNNFDRIISKFSKQSYKYIYAFSIRNSYLAYHESKFKNESLKDLLSIAQSLVKVVLKLFFTTTFLSNNSKIVLLNAHSVEKDEVLAQMMNIPLAMIENKICFSLKRLQNLGYLFKCSYVLILLLKEKDLKKVYLYNCFPAMLDGIRIYEDIELKGIEIIVTMADRYPRELGVLRKAKEIGIKTVRVDYFPTLGTPGMGAVACEYYFYPNIIARNIFQSLTVNKNVVFIEGGFPYWDSYSKYKHRPSNNPIIITFWSDYGALVGIDSLINKGSIFYIKEILSIIPEKFLLYIKVHPLDYPERYMEYESHNVKIIKHSEIDNIELISMSKFMFSILSAATFESKHICPGSCYINYEPESLGTEFPYDILKDYIDVIMSRNDLKAILYGEKKPKDQKTFIDFFNPAYPNSINKLNKFLATLSTGETQTLNRK